MLAFLATQIPGHQHSSTLTSPLNTELEDEDRLL